MLSLLIQSKVRISDLWFVFQMWTFCGPKGKLDPRASSGPLHRLRDLASRDYLMSFQMPTPRVEDHRLRPTLPISHCLDMGFWLGALGQRFNIKPENVCRETLTSVWPLFTGEAESGKSEGSSQSGCIREPRGPGQMLVWTLRLKVEDPPLHTQQSLCLGTVLLQGLKWMLKARFGTFTLPESADSVIKDYFSWPHHLLLFFSLSVSVSVIHTHTYRHTYTHTHIPQIKKYPPFWDIWENIHV